MSPATGPKGQNLDEVATAMVYPSNDVNCTSGSLCVAEDSYMAVDYFIILQTFSFGIYI